MLTIFSDKNNNFVSPKLLVRNVSQTAKFECNNGKNIQWHYEKSNSLPYSPPIATGKTLRINSVRLDKSGSYFCYGEYLNMEGHFLAKSVLTVYGKYTNIEITISY